MSISASHSQNHKDGRPCRNGKEKGVHKGQGIKMFPCSVFKGCGCHFCQPFRCKKCLPGMALYVQKQNTPLRNECWFFLPETVRVRVDDLPFTKHIF